MRRFIAILLLMLVPLQAAFGAAANYCQDERAEVASHFGHHEHEGAPVVVDTSEEGSSWTEADCQICHLASAQAAVSFEAAVCLNAQNVIHPPETAAQTDHPQHPFDRPPKLALA